MNAILLIVTSFGIIIGSLLGAAALCWSLWRFFKWMHHPEWAPIGILILVGLAVAGSLPSSPLLRLALAYAIAAALPLWIGGRSWRRRYLKASGKT